MIFPFLGHSRQEQLRLQRQLGSVRCCALASPKTSIVWEITLGTNYNCSPCCLFTRQRWVFLFVVIWIIQKYSVSFTSRQVYPHLTNVQLGHMTHFGQFLLLADFMVRDLAQVDVLTWLGMFFLASIISLKRVWSTRRWETHGSAHHGAKIKNKPYHFEVLRFQLFLCSKASWLCSLDQQSNPLKFTPQRVPFTFSHFMKLDFSL